MTKPKDLDSLSGVVGRAIELVGAGTVANAIGKSGSYVYQAADPDNSLTITDVGTLIEIDRVCMRVAQTAPYLAYHAKTVGISDEDEREIEDDVLLLTQCGGRLAGELRKARSPSGPAGADISPCEQRSLKEKNQEVREACDRIDASVTASSKPRLVAAE